MSYPFVVMLGVLFLIVAIVASLALTWLVLGWVRVTVWRLRADWQVRRRLRELGR